jgi:hypothetical protein
MSTDRKEEQVREQDALQEVGAGSQPGSDGMDRTPLNDKIKRELIAALQQNWQREMEGANV